MSTEHPLQLLWKNGAALASPIPVPHDDEGAQILAQLYGFDPERVTVRAMMNTTIDGAIAGSDGTSGSLSNPNDSFVFGVLRALADVIVVGASTVRTEDYRRPRGRENLIDPPLRPRGTRHPALAIWTSSGKLPEVIDPQWPTYLLCPTDACDTVQRTSGFPASQVLAADNARDGIEALTRLGMRAIQAEGGPSALGRLAEADLLDELCLSTTHRTVGGSSPRVIDGLAHERSWQLQSLMIGQHAALTRYRRGTHR